jgi:hypothetical protein
VAQSSSRSPPWRVLEVCGFCFSQDTGKKVLSNQLSVVSKDGAGSGLQLKTENAIPFLNGNPPLRVTPSAAHITNRAMYLSRCSLSGCATRFASAERRTTFRAIFEFGFSRAVASSPAQRISLEVPGTAWPLQP